MSAISVSVFLERLEQSNLLSEQVVRKLRKDIRRVGTAMRTEALGRRLIREGLLTRWHVQMLSTGKFAFFLGKYKLLGLLGQGGMGVVFKAEHSAFQRIVAIKVLCKERMNNPTVIARFHQEIQAAASLNNPHVVVAYDADCVRETHFLVMEYVDGVDLATIVEEETKLHVEEACEYIRQAAAGLQHAHERGMVHRDIKPSNLIVTRRGENNPIVKILDMGLARFVSDESDDVRVMDGDRIHNNNLTQTGQIMGTPDYMSPEQAWDTKAVDIRSDIYSLGCTLFLLLTGRFAFAGETPMAKVMARTMNDAPPVSSVEPSIPPSLNQVLGKMLARDPADRYQTPAEVARALEPFSVLSSDQLTLAEPVPGVPRGPAAAGNVPVNVTSPTVVAAESLLQPTPALGTARLTNTPLEQDSVTIDDLCQPPSMDPNLESFLQDLSTRADNKAPLPSATDPNSTHDRVPSTTKRTTKKKRPTSRRRRR